MNSAKTWICCILLIFIAFAAGVWYEKTPALLPVSASKQIRLGEGELTNPLLECEVAENTIDAEKVNFKPELERFVNVLEEKTNVNEIAVYFRDLNNGPTFGIQQEDPFIPASLLKVPVMMAYYRAADEDPEILNNKHLFSIPQTSATQQSIVPAVKLTEGKEYTTNDLIEQMILHSDNEALILLFKALPVEYQKRLYDLLGVDSSVVTDPAASLSVKQYAAFFRILYNSSFLSQKYSEKALALLSQIDFHEGLRKGVPSNIVVAHKFGERQIGTSERHLHDCGIVYYPHHPYLLCIMTRGTEIPFLERAIADISEFVFKKIDAQYKEQ